MFCFNSTYKLSLKFSSKPLYLYSISSKFYQFDIFFINCLNCFRFRLKIWPVIAEILLTSLNCSYFSSKNSTVYSIWVYIRKMGDRFRSCLMDDLPLHLIFEILSSGRLSALDLVCLELTSRSFGANHGLFPLKFRSLVDFAAFRLCESHPIYSSLQINSKNELFDRCNGNWKRVLRFLQSVEQSCDMVQTYAGNVLFLAFFSFIFVELSPYSRLSLNEKFWWNFENRKLKWTKRNDILYAGKKKKRKKSKGGEIEGPIIYLHKICLS